MTGTPIAFSKAALRSFAPHSQFDKAIQTAEEDTAVFQVQGGTLVVDVVQHALWGINVARFSVGRYYRDAGIGGRYDAEAIVPDDGFHAVVGQPFGSGQVMNHGWFNHQ